VSRAGSHVMNMGSRGALRVEGSTKDMLPMRLCVVEATRSIICAILSSSSGQMSGQWEKPK